MKKLLKKIKNFFRTVFFGKSNNSTVSVKEVLVVKKVYEDRIKKKWAELQKLLGLYDKKQITEKEFSERFMSDYHKIAEVENHLVMIKTIGAGVNALANSALHRKSNNEKIYRRGIYKERLKHIESLRGMIAQYDNKSLESFLDREYGIYSSRVSNLTVFMDQFNNKEIRLPFKVVYEAE